MSNLVSIVIPVYNMGDSLKKCVMSILQQNYNDIEIILVNDGSTDNSYEICCELEKKDSRITAYHTENRGSGPARNYGIKHANGEYIFFPDADDYIEEGAISTLVSETQNGKYDLIVFGYKVLTSQNKCLNIKQYPNMTRCGPEVRKDYSDYMGSTLKYGIQGAPWNKFFSMSIIRKNGVEYPPLRRHQDEGFIARYMCYSESIRFIDSILYIHYANDLSKEWDKYPKNYIDVVIGLHRERQSNILIWNKADNHTHDMVSVEYICGVIKALELSFSPKFCFNKSQREKWFVDAIAKSGIKGEVVPSILGKYQKMVLHLIKKDKNKVFYYLLWFKVMVEKLGLLRFIKKIILQKQKGGYSSYA